MKLRKASREIHNIEQSLLDEESIRFVLDELSKITTEEDTIEYLANEKERYSKSITLGQRILKDRKEEIEILENLLNDVVCL